MNKFQLWFRFRRVVPGIACCANNFWRRVYKLQMKGQMEHCSKGMKIDNVEIKIIMSVIQLGVKLIVAPYNEGQDNLLGHQMCWLSQQLVGRGKSL